MLTYRNHILFFLLGARGTGKSSLLKEYFRDIPSVYIDLLSPEIADRLSAHPEKILEIILPEKGRKRWIIIDEIQKSPKLLDIVHQQIQQKNFHFALTGSSTRKLKRGAANLLAGRAFMFQLFPLTHRELNSEFDLDRVLKYGSLPEPILMHDELDIKRFLKAYASTYLKEAIIVEQIIRNLPPFRRFLEVVALGVGEPVNYSNVAKDILSDPKTVSNYFQILEDTLIGFRLESYHQSLRKQQKKAPKFYLFDTGVLRALAGKVDYELVAKSYEYGQVFENFIVNEINRFLTYSEKQFKLSYIRVNEKQEIDLVIERAGMPIFYCEIKSSDRVDERHVNALETLVENSKNSIKLLLSRDPQRKLIKNTHALPWQEGIDAIIEGGVC